MLINIKINNTQLSVEKGTTIFNACKSIGIELPNFCNDERLNPSGLCRMCVVEIKGSKNLDVACGTFVKEGMDIYTNSHKVRNARREILELIISDHPLECTTCVKTGSCKLQDYASIYLHNFKPKYENHLKQLPIDDSNPFYYYDPNKCIMCKKCVRVCEELQEVSAIDCIDRGYNTEITPFFREKLNESTCVSCGNCVSVCPVGALVPKNAEFYNTKKVKTTCSYCGVGCQLELYVKDDKVVGSEPVYNEVNDGLLCVKGKFGYKFINHKDRLKSPLIKRDGKFEEVTWKEAYDYILENYNRISNEYGKESFAGLSSARCSNEENYLFQKMMRGVIGTNNVDHCARLCHSSTVAGLATTLGSGAMTNSIDEVSNLKSIFVIGSNTTENHPVIGTKIKQAVRKGAKLIVADPRRIELADKADVFLQIKPGTNVALLNTIMNVIISENLQDIDYIKERTENYEALVELVKDYTPEVGAQICEVKAEDIIKAARIYANNSASAIFYSMGITQHSKGTQNVMSISNLSLLCGNIGKEYGGVNPLRGQNNVQGACDMGALPNVFTGYQSVTNDDIVDKFEKAWNVKLSRKVGLTLPEIIHEICEDKIKFLYIMGENPMISDPDINHIKKAFETLDFLVVQDIFLTETAEMADVVLPASSFAEKDGTFTNTDRRIQRIRKAINPVGNSKPDWVILMEVMNKLGYEKYYSSPSEIMDEIARLTPQYAGINYNRIENSGLQWPCIDVNHPGTKILHQDKFTKGKATFIPCDYTLSFEGLSEEYPYTLITGRILYHYHTRTMTGRVEGLNEKAPHSYIEVNPITAQKLGFKDNEKIKVSSKRGEIETFIKITDIVDEDVFFIPFHFADGAANYLTNTTLDTISKIPDLKVCAIKVEKISESEKVECAL